LEYAHLDEETQLTDAVFDDKTAFAEDWPNLSDEEKAEARTAWLQRGMINVDAQEDASEVEQSEPAT
ncbi:MAG: hypothetical protein AAFQ90_04105, partial [Pseudomonadota bacterium]